MRCATHFLRSGAMLLPCMPLSRTSWSAMSFLLADFILATYSACCTCVSMQRTGAPAHLGVAAAVVGRVDVAFLRQVLVHVLFQLTQVAAALVALARQTGLLVEDLERRVARDRVLAAQSFVHRAVHVANHRAVRHGTSQFIPRRSEPLAMAWHAREPGAAGAAGAVSARHEKTHRTTEP